MSEQQRRVTTCRQLELLLEFLLDNRQLALGRLRSKEGRNLSRVKWEQCASLLNSEGPRRTGPEWLKVWNDLKSRVRSKLASIRSGITGTGGGPHCPVVLSSIEEKVADIIGRDIGPIAGGCVEGQILAEVPFVQAPQTLQQTQEFSLVIDVDPYEMPAATPQMITTVADSELSQELFSPMSPSIMSAPVTVPEMLIPPATAVNTPSAAVPLATTRRRRNIRRQLDTQTPSRSTQLSDVHAPLARIEMLRAEAASKKVEAAMMHAEAAKKTAEGVAAIAEAINNLSRSIERLASCNTNAME